MTDFKKLKVWQKSHTLTIATFKVAGAMRGPGATIVRNQWLRAAISVPTNIAEGSAKQSDPDYVRFLRIAFGSLTECEYHALLARDVGLISVSQFNNLNTELQIIGRMLLALIKALRVEGKDRRLESGVRRRS